jgi:uncharacterized membrane protein YgdD (TMEM256/DUF423 family)
MEKRFVVIGSLLFALAIILGAFGAHALKDLIPEKSLNSFEVGVRYQMFQAISILFLGINAKSFSFNLNKILLSMTIGILIFSFSIYFLTLGSLINRSFDFLGPLTPIGGVILITTWILFVFKLIKN